MPTLTHSRLLPGLLAALALSGSAQAGGPYVVETISPCRVLDTRLIGSSPGTPLGASGTLNINVAGAITGQGGTSAGDCGVPLTTTKGVFINVTAVNPAQVTKPSGYLTVYPYGETKPLASTINFQTGVTAIANGVMVPICDSDPTPCSNDLAIFNGPGMTVHVVIDVTGYLIE